MFIKSFFTLLLIGIFAYAAHAQNFQDTDGDGFTDGEEVAAGTEPLVKSSHPSPAPGTVFYVDNSGTPPCANTTSSGSETKPWCTINYAIGRIRSGDTLYVKAGTYTEQVYINRPAGTASKHTTIQAYPGHVVVIRGTGFSGSGRVKIENTSYITFNGFEITNFNQGLFVENSHDILVHGCEVYDVGQEAIHVKRGSSNVVIQECDIHDTRRYQFNGEGIYIGTSSSDQTSSGVNDNTNNVILKNNKIYNTNDECIELKEGTYAVTIDGNVLSNCLLDPGITSTNWGAIDVLEHENHYNANPNHIIKNNIIETTKTAIGLHTGGSVFNNIIYGQTGSYRGISIDNADSDTYPRRILHNTIDLPSSRAVVSPGSTVDIRNNLGPSSAGNLAVKTAYFVNAATRDYHLVSGSAPVNTGTVPSDLLTVVGGINTDRDNTSRPQGSGWDIGAYEFGGTSTPPPTLPPPSPTPTPTPTPPPPPSGDTTQPNVSLSAPVNNSTVAGQWVSLRATASDNVGVARVEFKIDGALVGTDTTSPYEILWDSTKFSNAAHVYSVVAVDTSGNVRASGSRNLTIQNQSLSTKFSPGASIRTNTDASVRRAPAGTSLGTQQNGQKGTVLRGPVLQRLSGVNYWWWEINFETSFDGWVAETALVAIDSQTPPPSPTPTPTPTPTPPPPAGSINAASCNRTDVQNAINAAKDGDTVVVPAGTCTWTSRLTITGKGITLQGAGIGQTTIVNGTTGTALQLNLTAGDPTTYVTGFTFNANNSTGDDAMILLIGGGLNQFRLHHFSMINLRERGIYVALDGMEVSGLIDHCNMEMPVTSGGSKSIAIEGTGPEESQPFSRPLELGSSKFIFIEDCTFKYGGQNDGAMDAYTGARYVFRHNTVIGTNVEHHGADSGFARGVHSFEIYNNNFSCPGSCGRKHYFRSGTGVIFNNTYSGNYGPAELTNYRSDESFAPWGKCDGSSPWDENKPGQNGYACLDQIGHVFGPTKGGANQLQPLYEWNNTHNGANVDLVVSTSHANADKHIVKNRDFYNDTPRPGYKPYTYPHPLQQK